MKLTALLFTAIVLLPSMLSGQSLAAEAAGEARKWRGRHEREIIAELTQLLILPNIAADTANIEKNAQAISSLMTARGIATKLLRVEGAPPLIVGDIPAAGSKTTIAFYAHYDGQPVDPTQWNGDPWVPVLRSAQGAVVTPAAGQPLDPEWRIYARSASDDKAAIIGMLAALDALKSARLHPAVNLRLVFEGEEEAGSPHLGSYLTRYADALQADAWIFCDGPVHQSRRMQLFFGARGVTDLELTVYGPLRPLHSGHYGNWAPNPIILLTHLIDSMRDAEARILIPGFYDDVRPLSAAENKALAAVPQIDESLRNELGLGRLEGRGKTLSDQILLPAINLRGISGGHVGPLASNAIPTEAYASIDFRLVPLMTPQSVQRKVEAHIVQQGYFIVRDTPDLSTRLAHPRVIKLTWGSGYPAARTDMDLPISRQIISIVTAATGPPVVMPSLGGSVPMYLFQGATSTPVIGLPIANHDNNQHAANENLRLKNLWDGIEAYAALFAGLR